MALDLATLRTYLTEAETARHQLATGRVIVSTTTIDGSSATYNQVSLMKLTSYIADLKNQIAKLESASRRGPIVFVH